VTELDGRKHRPNDRATFTLAATLATCDWCSRRLDVVPDVEAGINRHGEHMRIRQRVELCPGSGRPITATRVGDLLDDAIAVAQRKRFTPGVGTS